MEIQVKDRQSLPDVALQTSGSMEAAFGLAAANGKSLTDALEEGETLETVGVMHTETVRRYGVEGIQPATALSDEVISALAQEGVHFMGVEIDFIVS